jgi:hypothetical protein
MNLTIRIVLSRLRRPSRVISYYDVANGHLKAAHCVNLASTAVFHATR